MASFESLLEDTVSKSLVKTPAKAVRAKSTKPPRKSKGLGCENCELCSEDRKKFLIKPHGRKLMIIGSNPSEEDEENGKLFTSMSGKFLWKELAKVGIKKEDCDTQVALRCSPGFDTYIGNKKFKHPLRCCSEHTEKVLTDSQAKIYVIFGIEAARQALGKEFRVGTTILWSEKLKAKVYCLWQPGYYIKANVKAKDLKEFRANLALIAADLKKKVLSKYQYIYEQDYVGIVTGIEAYKEVAVIKNTVARYMDTHTKPLRVYCDEEAGIIKNQWETLCIGTCIKPGRVRVFVTSPLLVKSVKERKRIRLALKSLLEDPKIQKAFHHGSYDVLAIADHLDIFVEGFHFDTNYSTYLYNPDLRSYGLDNVGLRYFPEFGEYKTIILPESLPKDFDLKATRMSNATPTQLHDYITARSMFNLSQLPVEKLVRYNGGDCDLGKRLELMTAKTVSLPLLSIYTDVAFVLDAMAENGPFFDYKQYKKLREILPPRLKAIDKKLKHYAKRKDFNPNSPAQVAALLYDKLRLVPPEQSNKDRHAQKSLRSCGKRQLEFMSRKHEAPKLILERRRLAKMISTYLDSYGVCADHNKGRLRTKWWLTGTRTGRLSSGGGKAKDLTTTVVNLQNVHGDQQLQNMLVADPRWRKLYIAVKKAVATALDEFVLDKLKKLALDSSKKKDYEAEAEKCFEKLSKSLKFKRLCDKIVQKYGDVRIVLGFDQGQVEVRVMAQASGDKNLLKDCMSGDIHSMVGHRMTGWSVDKIKHDKKTRVLTKGVHFGILFGLSPAGVYSFIKIKDPDNTITEAKAIELLENYFKAYPGVARFMEAKRKQVEDYGFVDNMFGFVRPLGSGSDSYTESDAVFGSSFAQNQAVNTPIQGAAHQLMLMAMTKLKDKNSKFRKILKAPGMEVHDAIYWWTPLKHMLKSIPVAKELLEKEPLRVVKKLYPEIDWKIPLVVEGKAGFRLGDSVEIEEHGKTLEMHEILVRMFFESFRAETDINNQLRQVA